MVVSRSHWDGDYPHPTLNQSAKGSGGVGSSNQEIFSQRGAYLAPQPVAARMVAFGEYSVDGTASAMKARDYKDATDLVAQPFCLGGQHPNAGIGIDQSPTLTNAMGAGGGHVPIVSMAVRRLTPVECERLQGFPDNYTNIPWRKKDESPDGPRYKALGNSWAVPNVRWIGQRIQENLK